MVSIPSILLKRLYVANSLKNDGASFVFQLQNQIATGTVTGLSQLVVDGQPCALDDVTIAAGSDALLAPDLSDAVPVTFTVGSRVTVRVPGALPAGEHTIEITVQTREAGALTVPVADQLS